MKKERRKVFKKNIKPKHCNIKSLKNDGEVVKCYFYALDKALEDHNAGSGIDALSDKITTSINASGKTNPTKES